MRKSYQSLDTVLCRLHNLSFHFPHVQRLCHPLCCRNDACCPVVGLIKTNKELSYLICTFFPLYHHECKRPYSSTGRFPLASCSGWDAQNKSWADVMLLCHIQVSSFVNVGKLNNCKHFTTSSLTSK